MVQYIRRDAWDTGSQVRGAYLRDVTREGRMLPGSTILGFLHRSGTKLNTFLLSGVLGADVKEILRRMPAVDRLAPLDVPDTVFMWLAETRQQELRFSNLCNCVGVYGDKRHCAT